MKIYTSCQGHFLTVLSLILEQSELITKAKAIVSDSRIFFKLNIRETQNLCFVKEWEIYSQRISEEDINLVKSFEKKNNISLFKAIVADRRMIYGPWCKSKQDYNSRFSSEELDERLLKMAAKVLKDFETFKPDVCISFGITSVQDYLIFLIAKINGVKFIQIRATKILNYVGIFSNISSPLIISKRPTKISLSIAEEYIKNVQSSKTLEYEGGVKVEKIKYFRALRNLVSGFKQDILRMLNPVHLNDNHLEWMAYFNLRHDVLNKLKWKTQSKRFFRATVQKKKPYLVYPMHFEPEVAIQFYGPSYLNQIELIRTIAMNIPIGFHLLVKEHPRAYGFRSDRYYKKLQEIPRVKMVDPSLTMASIISHSKGVLSISGSTGFEAIIRGKPAWMFSDTYFTSLSDQMVKVIRDLNNLDREISILLNNFRHNDRELCYLIASLLDRSVPLDLYTGLLSKHNRTKVGCRNTSTNLLTKKIENLLIS